MESAKLFATLLLTLEGTPFLLQGEEIGMTNVYYDTIEEYNDVETINSIANKSPAALIRKPSLPPPAPNHAIGGAHRTSGPPGKTPVSLLASRGSG